MSAGQPLAHQLSAGNCGAQWKAIGNTFGDCQDIGNDAAMLTGKHLARAPKAGLDFIQDQQNTMLVADFAQGR
jgi:hypothetical protein